MSRRRSDLILHGPVTEAIVLGRREGKSPDVEALKARFPEVADELEEFVREYLKTERLFKEVVRLEIARTLEDIAASVLDGDLIEAEVLRERYRFVTERFRDKTIPELLAAIREALPDRTTGDG
jgi:hypothetical protein